MNPEYPDFGFTVVHPHPLEENREYAVWHLNAEFGDEEVCRCLGKEWADRIATALEKDIPSHDPQDQGETN